MNKLIIFTDGGARGNPGPAAAGVVIKTEVGQVLASISKKLGETTNNVAEYSAVVVALEWIKKSCQLSARLPVRQDVSCQFFLDSKLVVNQLNGLFKVKDGSLRNLMLQIRQLEQEIGGNVHYAYIPREKNWEADLLVNKALDNR